MGQIPHERIVSDPDIMMGKPTIKGTRITVELILEEFGEGLSIEPVLRAHPHLNKEQVLAARCGRQQRGGTGASAARAGHPADRRQGFR